MVTSLDAFMNDVNNYLSDPNKLPALAAIVADLNTFVGCKNWEVLRSWLVAQFPAKLVNIKGVS